MKILLLGRHASTADLESALDLPWSEGGKTESQDMAMRIKTVVRDLPLTIWSSSSQRGKETTNIVIEIVGQRCTIVEIKFFDELWFDSTHPYEENWLKDNITTFDGEALLVISHAEISEYAVSLGCEYIPLSTGQCMMVRGDWAIKI